MGDGVECFDYIGTPMSCLDNCSVCISTLAVAGIAVTAVLVLLVVAVVQSAVIWHQRK